MLRGVRRRAAGPPHREARVAEVKRGLRDPTPPTKLYSDLADYWTEFKVPQKRSGSDDLSIMKAHLRPFFGEMKLAEIGVAAVDRYLAEKSALSKKTVNNHLTLLITQLNLAFELRWIARVPRIKKPKIRILDADYSYLRTNDEIRRFLAAADEEGEAVFALYATAVYTGMRAWEFAGLRWDAWSWTSCATSSTTISRSRGRRSRQGHWLTSLRRMSQSDDPSFVGHTSVRLWDVGAKPGAPNAWPR